MSELILVFGKASIILLFGALAALSMKNATAAMRHTLWSSTLAGLVLLPLSLRWMPAWRVNVIPDSVDITDRRSMLYGMTGRPAGVITDVPAPPIQQAASTEQAALQQPVNASGSITNGAPMRPRGPRPVAYLYLLWFLGTVAVIARLLLGRIAIALVARRAQPVNAAWQQALAREAALLGIRRRIGIAQSGELATPVTFGSIRPVILVPSGSDAWDAARMMVVLQHELAHIARFDTVTQLIATVACAAYWPHPGVWMASRRLRIEQESACDDMVLSRGTEATEYADHLLDVARGATRLGGLSLVAIAMARPSHFEGRLLAILDDSRRRGRTGRAAVPLAACMVALIAMLGAFMPAQSQRVKVAEAPSKQMQSTLPPAVTPPAQKPREEKVLSFGTAEGGVLTVDIAPDVPLGEMTVTGTDSVSRISVRALDGATLRLLGSAVTLDSASGAYTLHVNGTKRARLDVRVPLKFDVTMRRGRTNLMITQVSGTFQGALDAGDISIVAAGGHAALKTDSGQVSIAMVNMDGYLETALGSATSMMSSGGISVKAGRNMDTGQPNDPRVEAFQQGHPGMVQVDGTDFFVRESAMRMDRRGEVVVYESLPNGAWITSTGSIGVINSTGPMYMKAAGHITLQSGNGPVYAVTSGGDVSITMAQNAFNNSDVFVETKRGDVEITLPAAMGATFDLETGYVTPVDPVRIEGPVALHQIVSADWESVGSQKQKMVRATGRIGDGGAKIHVRTMNGNIVIRQH